MRRSSGEAWKARARVRPGHSKDMAVDPAAQAASRKAATKAAAPKVLALTDKNPRAEAEVCEHVPPPILGSHFGNLLRQAREERGLSIQEVAQKTRISVRWVQALEDAELEGLPAEVFVSGYLRSYARTVGLDGQKILEGYHALAQERAERMPSTGPAGRGRGQGKKMRARATWEKPLFFLALSLLLTLGFLLIAFAWRRGLLHI